VTSPDFSLCIKSRQLIKRKQPSIRTYSHTIASNIMNANHNNRQAIDDNEEQAMITASEGDANSARGDFASSELGGSSSGDPATESYRGNNSSGGSRGKGEGSINGGSDSGEQEANEEDQDSQKSNQVRKMRRIMANRRSARESRDRRRRQLEDLQRSVDGFTANNESLARSNLALRQELGDILQKCGLSSLVSSSMVTNVSLEALLMGQALVRNN
jgi:hypothetical protein